MLSSERQGYGAAFNEIEIKDNIFIKRGKNTYGKDKLKKEIQWYATCEALPRRMPIPRRFLNERENSLELENLEDYDPLYKIFWRSSEEKKKIILERIYRNLELFHKEYRQLISRDTLERDVLEEAITKVVSRHEEVKDTLSWCNFTHVNHVKILSLEELLEYVRRKVKDFLPEIKEEYCLIHGDCQFNNILYSEKEDKLVFIDPRGYFGKTELYGLPQYDLAKILFALSGYDIVDSMEVDTLSFEKGNLLLPEIPFMMDILEETRIEHIFMISIWLGNAHCFRGNPMKAVLSHYYARYVGTLVYMSDTSLIR